MKNNNKHVLNKITRVNLKNKVKTLFMLISIILVTFMLYSVFSVGFSYYDNYQILNNRLKGTTSNIMIFNLDNQQIKKLNTLDYIHYYGVQNYCGEIVNETNTDAYKLVLTQYSQTEWEKNIMPTISDFDGKYPENENEIAISKWSLKKLGYDNKKIGDTLSLTVHNTEESKKFIICGIYKDYLIGRDHKTNSANVATEIFFYRAKGKEYSQYGNILVSEKYAKKYAVPLSQTFMITLKDKHQNVSNVLKKIHTDLNLKDSQIIIGFGLSNFSFDGIVSVLACTVIAIIIVISGYFIINNIMQISVLNDIHFYGQLKTLGATPKQIRTVVKKEVVFYSLIAVPIGMLLAAFLSHDFVPYFLKNLIAESAIDGIFPCDASFNPFLFLLVIIYVVFTVWVSCLKSAKIASRISPIEATRFNGVTVSYTKKEKVKLYKGSKLTFMALRNVLGHGKKTFSVFLSLFIGLFTCITIYSVVSNPDYTILYKRQQPYNFNIEADNFGNEGQQSDISEEDVSKIMAIKGVLNVQQVKTAYTAVEMDKNNYATIIILNENQVKQFSKLKEQTEYSNFINGKSVILLQSMTSKNNIGKNIGLYDSHEKKQNFIIDNLFIDDSRFLYDAQNYLIYDSDNICIYMSQKGIDRLGLNTICEEIKITTNNDDEKINKQINEIFINKKVVIKSQLATRKNLEPIINCIVMIGLGFSFILFLLGIFNFINIIVTSIHSRKRELAILEAIGMNKKQILRLLSLEGFIYFTISFLLLTFIGVPFSKILVALFHHTLYYFVYRFPTNLFVFLIILLCLICLLTPRFFYTKVRQETLIERLK